MLRGHHEAGVQGDRRNRARSSPAWGSHSRHTRQSFLDVVRGIELPHPDATPV